MSGGPLSIGAVAGVEAAAAAPEAVLGARERRDGIVGRRFLLADSPPARFKSCMHVI